MKGYGLRPAGDTGMAGVGAHNKKGPKEKMEKLE